MSRVEHLAEGVTLYLGDCREILPTLGRFDVLLCDPPYGIGFPYYSYDDSIENLNSIVITIAMAIENQAERSIITPGISNIHSYPKPSWIGAWTWETTATYGSLGYNQWQPILFYGKDLKGFGNVNGVIKSDRIHFKGGKANIALDAEGNKHSCPKPTEFMKRLTLRFTLPGETVCDPLMGSGTTGVAAVKLGRQFTGIELEPKYFDIACRRISEAMKQPDLFVEPPKAAANQEALL